MCLFWRQLQSSQSVKNQSTEPDYAIVDQTKFNNEPIYQKVKPRLTSTRTFEGFGNLKKTFKTIKSIEKFF